MATSSSSSTLVIVGASMAGLLAAAALTRLADRIVLLERDTVLDSEQARPGVPHCAHVHGLLSAGLQAFERLLPGIIQELEAAGAVPIRPLRDVIYCDALGVWPRSDSGPNVLALPRRHLELALRDRVSRLPNVEIWSGCQAHTLALDGRGQVCKVYYLRDRTHEQILPCTAVVDASGRGTLTLSTCKDYSGLDVPETRYRVDVAYASARYCGLQLPQQAQGVFVSGKAPEQSSGGVILAQGRNHHVVSLVGRAGAWPPGDLPGFLKFARALPHALIGEIIGKARPMADIRRFAVRESIRRDFSRMPKVPGGLFALGDAVCRFNPVHGQGISVAALQAELLQRTFGGERERERTYWRGVSALLEVPWRFSTSPDLCFASTQGERPWWLPLGQKLADFVAKAAFCDEDVRSLVAEIYNLIRPPHELLHWRWPMRLVRSWHRYNAAPNPSSFRGQAGIHV